MAKKKDQEIWRDWQEELKEWQESDRDQREQANESDYFMLDKDGQWEDWVARKLEAEKRPRYTFDKLTPLMESMMADIEDMDFAGNVKPADGAATKENALTYDGMLRSIQNESNTENLYRASCRRNMRRGFDAWVVKAKYLDEWSFDQDLVVEQVPNAVNRVWTSNTATNPDGSDSPAAYVLTSMSPASYKEQFPKGSGISVDDNIEHDREEDYQPAVITIADRYYQKENPIEVAQLTNGEVVELDEKWDMVRNEYRDKGITIAEVDGKLRIKKVKGFQWYMCRFDGGGILEEEKQTVFTGNPVVTIYGNFEISGNSSKRTFSGIVLKQMDTQRVHNYAKSRDIEESALSPRAKLMMTKKQAAGNEEQLQRMNTSADPVQFWTPDPESPPPYYLGGPQINEKLTLLGQQTALDIREQLGVTAAMQGEFAGRQSEDSIKNQIDRGTAATRKWVNALTLGIQRVNDLLVQAIPIVYDTKRMVSIIGVDGTKSVVEINSEVWDKESQTMVKVNDLNKGKYKVTVDAGPAFANRLEAGLTALTDYAALDPSVVQIGGDIMLRAIDAPLVDQVADRKRSLMLQEGRIPEEQMSDEEKERAAQMAQQQQQPDPMMVAAQAEQTKADADMAGAENDRIKLQLELEKLRLEGRKLEIEEAKLIGDMRDDQVTNDINAFKAETDRIATQIDAQEAGATIRNKEADTLKKQVEAANEVEEAQQRRIADMSNEELFRIANG